MKKLQMKPLSECCTIVSGATPDTENKDFWDGEIHWATPKDLSSLPNAYISATPRTITKAGLKSCSAQILPAYSVLFSSRAPIGHVAINTIPMATNQGFKSFVPRAEIIHFKYLYWWLKHSRKVLENLGNGATFKEISKSTISKVKIPLPPLEEQRRIAEILDKAEALRTKRRAALAELDALTQSLFLDMFGDPATNPMGWEVKPLSKMVKVIGGYAFKSGDFSDEGHPIVRISNLNVDSLDLSNAVKISSSKLGRGKEYILNPGEILIAMSGATTGKLGIVPKEHKQSLVLNQRVGCYRITNKKSLHKTYLYYLIKSDFYQNYVWKLAAGAAQPNISSSQLESAMVPLPDIESQMAFANSIAQLTVVKNKQQQQLIETDLFIASLQQSFFP